MNITKAILLKIRKYLNNINSIGSNVRIGREVLIKNSVLTGAVAIGDNCRIIGTDMSGNVTVGRYTSIWGPNICLRSAVYPISIGNFCSIAKNVTIQEYNHDYHTFTTYFLEQNLLKSAKDKSEVVSKGPIIIEHDVWIGTNAVILSGSHISTGAIVAAGSVVSGFVPPYAIVGGIPARVIKYRFDDKTILKLLDSKWWEWEADKIKANLSILKSYVDKNN